MTTWERWLTHGLVAVVFVSGTAYFWMKYALTPSDPFSVVNHPWQPAMLHLHILSAPFLILLFGIVYQSHVLRKLRNGQMKNRRSGWVILGLFLPMVVSGYLLQVVTSRAVSQLTLAVHIGSGVAFVIAYTAHAIVGWRIRQATLRAAPHDRAVVQVLSR